MLAPERGKVADLRLSQQTRTAPARSAAVGARYCTAARGSQKAVDRSNKPRRINALTGYDTILTWPDAVSMVRAAFEGDGASFLSPAAFVSGLHSMAEG